MKITKITQQKKNLEKVNIFLDEKYWISLDKNTLIAQELFVGREIVEADVANLEKLSSFAKNYYKSLNFCMLRPRSEKEVFQKMVFTYKLEPLDAEKIIKKLKQNNIIDDANFAMWFVQSRLRSRKLYGKNLVFSQLLAKGISTNDFNIAWDEIFVEFGEMYYSKLKEFLHKEGISSTEKLGKNKILQKLVSKGYSFSDVQNSLKSTD